MGGHLDFCEHCGLEQPAYDSCRDRHCPKCQGSSGARWVEKRMETFLPTDYFHVVLTLPAELRPLFLGNRAKLLELLFKAAADTLKELANNKKWLGAQPAFTLVLHTWAKDLVFHPHIHCVISSGGLTPDRKHWKATREKFLFPIWVVSALFRGKLLAMLKTLYEAGSLTFRGKQAGLASPQLFTNLLRKLYQKKWVIHIKAPFSTPEFLYRYLSLYTHRVGLTNPRLLGFEGDKIRLRTRDEKSVLLTVTELIRRFALHILPARFIRIRHYGLFAPSNLNGKRLEAQALLEAAAAQSDASRKDTAETPPLAKTKTEAEPQDRFPLCPRCGAPMARVKRALKRQKGPDWKQLFGARGESPLVPPRVPVAAGASG
jgi:hypothetical protein